MADMLAATAGQPEVTFGPGDDVITEGSSDGVIWVLVSGALAVRKGDAPGLTLVSTVLRDLEQRSGTIATSGSMREPHPEY